MEHKKIITSRCLRPSVEVPCARCSRMKKKGSSPLCVLCRHHDLRRKTAKPCPQCLKEGKRKMIGESAALCASHAAAKCFKDRRNAEKQEQKRAAEIGLPRIAQGRWEAWELEKDGACPKRAAYIEKILARVPAPKTTAVLESDSVAVG